MINDAASLLLVNLSGCRELLAQSRRSRDWWITSLLLTELECALLQALLTAKKAEVITPRIDSPQAFYPRWLKLRANFPQTLLDGALNNLIIIRLPDSEITPPYLKNAERAVQSAGRQWLNLGLEQVDFISELPHGQIERQFDNLFHIFYTSVPVSNSINQALSDSLEKLELSKRTHNLESWTKEPPLKCTLCGVREVLTSAPSAHMMNLFWKRVHSHPSAIRFLAGDENLCAVCLARRMLGSFAAPAGNYDREDISTLKNSDFPSTYEMAGRLAWSKADALPDARRKREVFRLALENLLKELAFINDSFEKSKLRAADIPADKFRRTVDRFYYDNGRDIYPRCRLGHAEEWFLPDRIARDADGWLRKVLDMEKGPMETDRDRHLKSFYRLLQPSVLNINSAINAFKDVRDWFPPNPYVVYIVLEGDDAAEALCETAGDAAGMMTELKPQMRNIINKWRGKSLYLGTNKIIAFGPVEGAVKVAQDLSNAYIKGFSDASYPQKYPRLNIACSIAVVYANAHEPIGEMINRAHSAIRDYSRNRFGSNALSIITRTASGTETIASGKFGVYDKLVDELVNVQSELANLSDRWLQSLLEALPVYYVNYSSDAAPWEQSGWPNRRDSELGELTWAELERLWKRQLISPKSLASRGTAELAALKRIWKPFITGEGLSDEQRTTDALRVSLENTLRVASFIARRCDTKEES